MSYTLVCILVVVGVLVIAAIAALIYFKRADSKNTFNYCFNREAPVKWSRQCSDPANRDLYRMWDDGNEWASLHRDNKEEITCASQGGDMHAQYYDFGSDRAVIIVPGMFESSSYSYYYADVYMKAGYNCCLIDNRATGLSAGQYNTVGMEERKDIADWARCLHDRHDIKEVVLHGISMGAANCVLALNEPACPKYVKAFICDECYPDFRTYFRNYFAFKTWRLGSFNAVMKKVENNSGNPDTVRPSDNIDHVEVPVLFIAGQQDQLVSNDETRDLFGKCGTALGNKDKEIIWFDYGLHGFLRSSDPEKYDQAIYDFLAAHDLAGTS